MRQAAWYKGQLQLTLPKQVSRVRVSVCVCERMCVYVHMCASMFAYVCEYVCVCVRVV